MSLHEVIVSMKVDKEVTVISSVVIIKLETFELGLTEYGTDDEAREQAFVVLTTSIPEIVSVTMDSEHVE